MKKTNKKKKRLAVVAIIAVVVFIGWLLAFGSAFSINQTACIYVDKDDNVDSVYAKIEKEANPRSFFMFKIISKALGYDNNVRTGRYEIKGSDGNLAVVRRLKNKQQTPVSLTIPSVRTLDKLSSVLSEKLMMDSITLLRAIKEEAITGTLGYDTATIACLFIPNTYEVYWDITPGKFLKRMKQESDTFWTTQRKEKAKEAGLTENEVITIASIVDEETANDGEKQMIAGMYVNRYKLGMPLQADPTIKFAWRDFSLKRIYNKLLSINSPYNTYRNIGLPPGPIRIPSVKGIDAVLEYAHHEYLYMCAKEDFSGTHNFAKTYPEHLANAAKYTKALNDRGVK